MAEASALVERRLVTMLVDLAGFTRAVAGLTATQVAALLDEFYSRCGSVVGTGGGRVVKFVGDACLSTWGEAAAEDAVDCAVALSDEVRALGSRHGVGLDAGANIHLSTVVDGEFAEAGYDVAGQGVIYTFRMGSGPGIRISEPVYRQLASERRGAWTKHRPPATYTLNR